MVHSLLPLFVPGTLGVSVPAMDPIEGVAEATAMISKLFADALGDYLGRRKGLALLGCAMGACSKPVVALARGAGGVVATRFVDRVDQGLRGAPVAGHRGRLRRALVDHCCAAGLGQRLAALTLLAMTRPAPTRGG
jgi:hypothetical protein